MTGNHDDAQSSQPKRQRLGYIADSLRSEQDRLEFMERSNQILDDLKKRAPCSNDDQTKTKWGLLIEVMSDLRDYAVRWRVCTLSLNGATRDIGH